MMWMLGIFSAVLLVLLGQSDGTCSPGFSVLSFNTIKATSSSPAVCAVTTDEELMSVMGQTVDKCANRCAFNESCVGFNQKYSDPTVCDMFATLPITFTHDPGCTYYEVGHSCMIVRLRRHRKVLHPMFCRFNLN